MKYGTMNFKFMSDSINYKFHTTHNGRFRIRTDNFYGNKIAEFSKRYNPFKTKKNDRHTFVLDRYFSPRSVSLTIGNARPAKQQSITSTTTPLQYKRFFSATNWTK